ncbi:hypothetical protein DFJ73DRAFT_809075 [Zopfochytrium polystomum]|nr:hypothetical protein DFJ73DRAFT_809075 [Zopfochytrium polystomum]
MWTGASAAHALNAVLAGAGFPSLPAAVAVYHHSHSHSLTPSHDPGGGSGGVHEGCSDDPATTTTSFQQAFPADAVVHLVHSLLQSIQGQSTRYTELESDYQRSQSDLRVLRDRISRVERERETAEREVASGKLLVRSAEAKLKDSEEKCRSLESELRMARRDVMALAAAKLGGVCCLDGVRGAVAAISSRHSSTPPSSPKSTSAIIRRNGVPSASGPSASSSGSKLSLPCSRCWAKLRQDKGTQAGGEMDGAVDVPMLAAGYRLYSKEETEACHPISAVLQSKLPSSFTTTPPPSPSTQRKKKDASPQLSSPVPINENSAAPGKSRPLPGRSASANALFQTSLSASTGRTIQQSPLSTKRSVPAKNSKPELVSGPTKTVKPSKSQQFKKHVDTDSPQSSSMNNGGSQNLPDAHVSTAEDVGIKQEDGQNVVDFLETSARRDRLPTEANLEAKVSTAETPRNLLVEMNRGNSSDQRFGAIERGFDGGYRTSPTALGRNEELPAERARNASRFSAPTPNPPSRPGSALGDFHIHTHPIFREFAAAAASASVGGSSTTTLPSNPEFLEVLMSQQSRLLNLLLSTTTPPPPVSSIAQPISYLPITSSVVSPSLANLDVTSPNTTSPLTLASNLNDIPDFSRDMLIGHLREIADRYRTLELERMALTKAAVELGEERLKLKEDRDRFFTEVWSHRTWKVVQVVDEAMLSVDDSRVLDVPVAAL